ncbi:hypothetical protein F4815DRAFT_469349 [Daldinia loculata]|nr:hypothetical protein F4815DRAFT_469349 [Daldinia loculata]
MRYIADFGRMVQSSKPLPELPIRGSQDGCTPRCLNCGYAEGHRTSHCHPSSGDKRVCYRCQSPGHLSKDCPFVETARSRDNGQGVSRPPHRKAYGLLPVRRRPCQVGMPAPCRCPLYRLRREPCFWSWSLSFNQHWPPPASPTGPYRRQSPEEAVCC